MGKICILIILILLMGNQHPQPIKKTVIVKKQVISKNVPTQVKNIPTQVKNVPIQPRNNIQPNLVSQMAHPMQFVQPPVREMNAIMERPQSTKGSIKDADLMNITQRME